MPFYDFNSSNAACKMDEYDCCIIGAGAAGILLAMKLNEKGKRVLVVESGHFTEDHHRQSLNEVVNSSKILATAGWGRKRAIGGTTIAWGGQSLPFAEIDFEQRAWVQNSGWPIQKADLEENYRHANKFMGIDTLDFDEEIFSLLKLKRQPFNNDLLIQHFSKWAPEPNFRVKNEEYLRKHIDLLYNAQLTKITLIETGKKIEIEITGFDGKKIEVIVPKLILAAGAIETNRILLLNDHQFKGGIGNHSAWLGKCFMEHPCMEVGTVLDVKKPYTFQQNFNTHLLNHIRYSPKISLSKKAQTENKLLNASTSFLFDYTDGFNPYADLKAFIKTKNLARLINAAKRTPSLMRSTFALINEKFYYKHGALPKLGVMLEQEPITKSYIGLSNKVDRFNQPKVKINWEISELSWKTAIFFMNYVQSELERLNFGKIVLTENFKLDNRDWLSCLSDVNHHMGGTKMSKDKFTGVVNENCQVWGLDNLYISSASVFPTSSHSNPTLTLLALSDRIADHVCMSS